MNAARRAKSARSKAHGATRADTKRHNAYTPAVLTAHREQAHVAERTVPGDKRHRACQQCTIIKRCTINTHGALHLYGCIIMCKRTQCTESGLTADSDVSIPLKSIRHIYAYIVLCKLTQRTESRPTADSGVWILPTKIRCIYVCIILCKRTPCTESRLTGDSNI